MKLDLIDCSEIAYDVRSNMRLIVVLLESWEDLTCGHCDFTDNMRATLRFMIAEHLSINADKLDNLGDMIRENHFDIKRKKLRLRRVVEHSDKRNYNDSRADKE